MSIDYYGVRTDDPDRVGELVEAKEPVAGIAPIDVDAVYAAMIRSTDLRGKPGDKQRLSLERDGAHVSVYISTTSVQLNHNTGGDFDDIMDDVMLAQEVMTEAGLNVWDPQQGEWFPGSPVLEDE